MIVVPVKPTNGKHTIDDAHIIVPRRIVAIHRPLDKSDFQEDFHARFVTVSMTFRGNTVYNCASMWGINIFHVPEIQRAALAVFAGEREFSCCARSRRPTDARYRRRRGIGGTHWHQ